MKFQHQKQHSVRDITVGEGFSPVVPIPSCPWLIIVRKYDSYYRHTYIPHLRCIACDVKESKNGELDVEFTREHFDVCQAKPRPSKEKLEKLDHGLTAPKKHD